LANRKRAGVTRHRKRNRPAQQKTRQESANMGGIVDTGICKTIDDTEEGENQRWH
jgi:hypothetical protein